MAKYKPPRKYDELLPNNKLSVFGTHYPSFKSFKDFIEETERSFGKNDIFLRQPYHVNRRHQASLENLYKRLQERYAGVEGLCGQEIYENLLLGDCVFFSTVPHSVRLMDDKGDIKQLVNGASLYVLNYAKSNEAVFHEMKALLEEEMRYYAEHMEKYSDDGDFVIRHENAEDEEYRRSLARILFNRNADALMKNKEERNLKNREILNTVLALGKQNEAWSSYRNFFNRLMEMLSQEDIEKHLRDLQDLEDRICDFLIMPQAKINKEFAELLDAANAQIKKRNARKEELLAENKITLDALRNLENNFEKPSLWGPQCDKPIIPGEVGSLEILTKQAITRMDQLKDITFKRIERLRGLGYVPSLVLYPDRMKEYLKNAGFDEEEATKTIESLPLISAQDPYGMCFALIYAAEHNMDIAWAGGITEKAFTIIEYAMPIVLNLSPLCEKAYDGEKVEPNKGEGVPEIHQEDLYGLDYKRDEKGTTRRISLAQIVYEDSSHILPQPDELTNCFYQKYLWMGIEKREAILMAYLVQLYRNADKVIERMAMEDDEKNEELIDQEESPEAMKEHIRELRKKCKEQEKQLYEVDRANREYQKTIEGVRQEAEEYRTELADLREMIFNQQTPEENDEEEQDTRFEFPYTVKKNTVIFGGHRTWSKAIKPMLEGNVRFIDERMLYKFDPSIISNTDVVWIQVNAISHPSYYRIVEKARALHKKVRYFTKASAMAGAIQVAEEDIAS